MAIVGSEDLLRKISSQIESQFPAFIREEGANFVAFMKAYYEYMEQSGNAGEAIRSLEDVQDIDRTVDSFVEYFRREFMINIPKDILADKRLLTKHIREFYRSRGSQQSYRFLFRALFDKEIDFYYPGDDILRASDGRWVRETKLRVGEPYSLNPMLFEGSNVRGVESGATALVQKITSTIAAGIVVYDMVVENVAGGTFVDGERVVDDDGNYVTVNAQVGSLIDIEVHEGGAYHNINDIIEIGGAGSSEAAQGIVTETNNTGALGLEVKLIKGGSGYTRDNAKIVVTGGDGYGFEAAIQSFAREPIATTLAVDFIAPFKNIPINTGPFFVAKGANTATVRQKLTGTVKITSSSNTVVGQGTSFVEQLNVGDIVRVKGSANTLRVHSITNAQTFVSAIAATTTITSGANAYSGIAAANVSSTIGSALRFSANNYFLVNAISIINPGWGYSVYPTITIVDSETSPLNIADGYGGYLGRNAVVSVNTAPGAIKSLRILSPGQNFNKFDTASLVNLSKGIEFFTKTIAGANVSGGSTNRFVRQQRTYSGTATPIPSGIVTFPGKYIDTKGFLSWDNKLQDNYYYQEFSYVIRVSETLDKYRDIIKRLLHPSGTKQFSDLLIDSSANTIIIVGSTYSNILDVQVSESTTSTDSVVGRLNTSAIVTTESVTLSDSIPTAEVTKNVGHEESISATDSTDATNKAVASVSESVSATDSVNGTYVSGNLTSGTESVTTTDSTDATNIAVASTTETVSATDSTNGTYNSVNLTSGTESVSTADNVVGNGITSTTFDTTMLNPSDDIGVQHIIGGVITESISVSDSTNATNKAVGALIDNNGEITPYASVLISSYQSTLISDVIDPTLNLDDTVNRT